MMAANGSKTRAVKNQDEQTGVSSICINRPQNWDAPSFISGTAEGAVNA